MKLKKGLSVLLSIGLAMSMCVPCLAEEASSSVSAAEESSSESIVEEISSESAAEETSSESAEKTSAVSAAEDVTAESLVDHHKKKCEEGVSITAEERLDVAMKMAAFGEKIAIDMEMLFNVETAGDISHLDGEMHMTQENTSEEEENQKEDLQTEVYAEKNEDGTYTVYTLDPENDTWSKSVLDKMEFNMDLTSLIQGDDLVLSDETVQIDGRECYEVKGKMALQDMAEYLGDSMEGMEEIIPVDAGIDAGEYKLDVVYYFDKETQDLFSMKMDGSAMLEKMFQDVFVKSFSDMSSGGTEEEADEESGAADAEAGAEEEPGFDVDALLTLFKIEIPAFVVEVNHIEFGTLESIEIPEEVLAAEMTSDAGSGTGSGIGESGNEGETIPLDGLTVIDNEECSIILEEIIPNDTWGYTIRAELENKSPDKKLSFSVDNAYVDGVENYPYFMAEVAPGKKAKESITFEDADMLDLLSFSDIEMEFRVYDSEDWSADPVAEETAHVYPKGEEAVSPFVYEPADTDQVLYEDESVSIVYTGVDQEDTWGYTLNVYIVNKTDVDLYVSTDDVSVNGYMVDPYFSHVLAPGKSAFTEISWSYSDLEDKGITDVEEVEFTLTARDNEDWEAEDLVHELITFTV